MTKKRRTFRLGHLYSIDYDDNYSTEKSYREEEDATPCVLRARGMVIAESDRVVVLEHSLHVTDRHATNKRSDRHGIVKACIIKVRHYGPERG